MVSFGGFEMPVSYTRIKEEHHCVRKKVGVFDVSHMGRILCRRTPSTDLITASMQQ